MAELRRHPFTKDWVMIASHRQNRPQMPNNCCPFCPGSGKVPEHYDVYKYDNDFPALSLNPPEPDDVSTAFFEAAPAYGKCEVILYSSKHTTTLPELPTEHIKKLVGLWAERFESIKRHEKIKFVFIFENKGDVVGVTMPHPHGQIYGYPFIPKKVELKLESSKEYFEETHECLFCSMLREELEFKKRIIFSNEHFTVFLPFFTEYPYGIYVYSNAHKQNISDFNEEERTALAETLRQATGTLDSLFDYQFPYMMCMNNAPVNSGNVSNYYHFHIEFFPPMRSADKVKFNASSETGVWSHCNPRSPEETAEELRQAHKKFMSN